MSEGVDTKTNAPEATGTSYAKGKFVDYAVAKLREADTFDKAASHCVSRAVVATELAALPEELALRALFNPDLFRIVA